MTYFEAEVVHVFVCGAVDGALCVELQRVKDGLTLHTEGATQLEVGVADLTGPVVHKLEEENQT